MIPADPFIAYVTENAVHEMLCLATAILWIQSVSKLNLPNWNVHFFNTFTDVGGYSSKVPLPLFNPQVLT